MISHSVEFIWQVTWSSSYDKWTRGPRLVLYYMGITASIRKPPLFFCPYFLRLSITFIIFVTFFLNISFEYDHFRTRTLRHGLKINRIMYPHMIFFFFFFITKIIKYFTIQFKKITDFYQYFLLIAATAVPEVL